MNPDDLASSILDAEAAKAAGETVAAYWLGLGDDTAEDTRTELTVNFANHWLSYNWPSADSDE